MAPGETGGAGVRFRRCETCRHWDRSGHGPQVIVKLDAYGEDVHEQDEGPQRRCLAIIHGNDYAKPAYEHAKPTTTATVFDGEGFAATLYTLPTFGCTLYSPKEGT